MEQSNKILVIDYEAYSVFVINQILLKSKEKFELFNAFNAKAALKIVKNETPDLIISYWNMPDMTGMELIRELKGNSETASIPIIICSGIINRSENLMLADEANAIDNLPKPIGELELMGRIREILNHKDANNQLPDEREKQLIEENKLLHEKIDFLNTELKKRGLLICKYSELFKNIFETLKEIPTCSKNNQCKTLINGLLNKLIHLNHSEKLEELHTSFDEIYPNFFTSLLEKHPDLTKSELKLAALLKLRLSTKEISSITGQTIRAVEMTRFRLRSKLNLQSEDNISKYL